ncbi:hypothetical protein [Stenomitos frigidus]|nr:hypothetical protein [Stenomitos frigidus]
MHEPVKSYLNIVPDLVAAQKKKLNLFMQFAQCPADQGGRRDE